MSAVAIPSPTSGSRNSIAATGQASSTARTADSTRSTDGT